MISFFNVWLYVKKLFSKSENDHHCRLPQATVVVGGRRRLSPVTGSGGWRLRRHWPNGDYHWWSAVVVVDDRRAVVTGIQRWWLAVMSPVAGGGGRRWCWSLVVVVVDDVGCRWPVAGDGRHCQPTVVVVIGRRWSTTASSGGRKWQAVDTSNRQC